MTEKYIPYSVDGRSYKIPESKSAEFEKTYPSATIRMSVDDRTYNIPLEQKNEFMKTYSNATYAFDEPSNSNAEEISAPVSVDNEPEMTRKERRQARRDARAEDDRTGFFESLGKGLGAGVVGATKDFTDLVNVLNTGTGTTGAAIISQGKFDEALLAEDNPLYKTSANLGDTQEKLSREADPTAGESSFWDLIKEGKLGTAMQKAVASGAESLPMMFFSRTIPGSLLYGSAMAASNYIDETQENPDIPSWKRAINAAGTAALELAIERLGGPLKAKGKLTKEAITKFLNDVAKEGTETIAKRIFKGIGGVVKEGWEEGWEEVGTSFGNDILGTALDAIDGDADYGIKAQWEQLKDEDPNADAWDFAKMKGAEYMDSYIGGALSGMEISGAVKGINKGVSLIKGETRSAVEAARESGATMDYGDMYDTDSLVEESATALESTLVDKDGNPIVDRAFIDNISADEAYALAGRENLSNEQRKAFFDYAVAKAQSDGLNEKLDNRLNEKIAGVKGRIDEATDDHGRVIVGTVDGKAVYVKGGYVTEKGTVATGIGDVDGYSYGPVIVIDSVTGEKTTVSSDKIQSPSAHEAYELFSGMESVFREREANERDTARNTVSPRAKLNTVMGLQNRKMLVDLGNGLIEVEVMKVDPKTGEVMIKGKKGDLGGRAITKLGSDVFYDSLYRDESGEFAFVDEIDTPTEPEDVPTDIPVAPETTTEEGPAAETPAEVTETPDYRGETYTILQNGVPVEAEVVSQDEASDTVVYRIIGENGQPMLLSSTIGEFGSAIEAAVNPAPVAPEVGSEPEVEAAPETPADVEPEAPAAPIEPEAIDWDALFESDPEAYFAELQNQFGEEALDILKEEIEAAQNELDALAKAKTKTQNERLENRKRKAALQSKIEALNGMVARLSQPVAPETAPVTPEVPAAPETVTPEPVVPVAPTPVEDSGETPGNSVPLENEPKGEDNGKANEPETEDTEGRVDRIGSEPANDEGSEESGTPSEEVGGSEADNTGQVEDKYPARTGDVTPQILKETFGMRDVASDISTNNLNSIYDFMMEMAKILGISPKSIGHGATLGAENYNSPHTHIRAQYSYRQAIDGTVKNPVLRFRNAALSSIAHEWWHSLDTALAYYETGKTHHTATNSNDSNFAGRAETLKAVKDVLKAINKSGHKDRLNIELANNPSYLKYSKQKDEMSARAFEEYILMKFAEAGIEVGSPTEFFSNRPNAEEMKVIAPAFDKLFEVLQEKEGKTPGTSVLFQIGQEVDEKIEENNTSEVARKLANEAIDMMFEQAGREVVFVTDEQAEQMRRLAGADAEFMISSDKPVFVSNAAVAVMGIKQEKATPAQWLAMIEKAGGLKAGEDKWMGLSDWLKASDKKTITKQEVLDYIADNTIKIEEVNYAEIDYFAEDKKFIDAINSEFIALRKEAEDAGEWIHDAGDIAYQQMVDKYGDDFSIAFGVDLGELYVSNREAASAVTGVDLGTEKEIDETRLGYTTAGLSNYKEIALVVPTIEPWNQSDEIHFGDAGNGRAVAWIRFGETKTYAKEYADFYAFQEKMQQKYFPDRRISALSNSDLESLTAEEKAEFERLRDIARSIPMKERTRRRVLVIDEIQSKRHQEGREKGYKPDWRGMKRLRKALDDAKENFAAIDARMIQKYGSADNIVSQTDLEEYQSAMKAVQDAYYELSNPRFNSIPDAPFDKNWQELAMKRMLRYAAENGYDAVAWTKGEQQAERYNLGKVYNEIEREDNPNIVGRTFSFSGENYDKVTVNEDGVVVDSSIEEAKGKPLSDLVGKDLAVKMMSIENYDTIDGKDLRIGGEGMKGFYDKMLPAFMNKYGKKWGIKVADITLPNVEETGRVMHSVPVTDAMKESVMEGQVMFMKRPNGKVFGWTDGKKIYLTKDGLNPNTKIHEYTHLWAQAMMHKNPKGWQSVKDLLRGTPVWNEVLNDPNYSNIHADEDLVASEVLSRISGRDGSAKLERMAQQMVDEAKGSMRKLEARGLIQRIKDALNEFWNWVGTELFGIEKFESVEQVTDRVIWDLMNATDLGELSEGQVETQIVTDPKVIAELEASPKRTGYRNVVQNEDGSFSSPMAYWLQNPDAGAKSRIATAKFEMGKWEEAEEHPEVVSKNGYVTLVKPNKKTVGPVAYDPYIHNRLDPVNLQFKEAWKRNDLVYVETEVAETDLESGYHADKAKLPVGVHSWSNGSVMLSKYDKPVRVLPWEDVANAWAARLNGEGVEFDVVPPALLPLLVERGVEILPPHKNSGKDCENAYAEFKNAQETKTTSSERGGAVSGNPSSEGLPLDDRGHLSHNSLVHPIDLANVEKNTIATKAAIKKLFNRGSFKEKITDALSAVREVSKALKLVKSDSSLSYYSDLYEGDFEINGKIAHVRISGHPANGERMGNAQADTKISLVIYDNGEHVSTGIHEGYVEYTYYPSDIDPEDAAWSIANGIKSLLEGNGFVDNSGKAKEQPYPYNNGEGNFVYRKADAQNAAVDYLAGEPRLRAIENAVNEEASKLGVKVTYKTREQMPNGHQNDKGYYDPKTGEIVVCTENATSIADAIQTILHEAVAHKGLRQLMGDKFNEFINRVYDSLDAETKAKVDALAESQHNGNKAVAMEEYMATLAESTDFKKDTLWDKIKSIFEDIINAILGRNDIKIGDNELRYILRASYNNMVNPRGMETMRGWAQDQMMREEYKINDTTPDILSRTGIDPSAVSREAAKSVYDKVVNDTWQEMQRQFQDAYQPVRIAIDAIQQETGNIPIEDYENYLLIQNQSSSRSRVEIDEFAERYYSPIVEQVNKIIDTIMESRGWKVNDADRRAEVYGELRQYLIAKHGLERNEYYQTHKMRNLTAAEKRPEYARAKQAYDTEVANINADTSLTDAERELKLRDAKDAYDAAILEINTREVPDIRDYSGLTSLFGLEPKKFRQAEAEARNLVDNAENMFGPELDILWERINKATDKTLRHSYESGIISRQQYNDIKDMFEFYIPLRGFEDITAEDIYSYARFEGNRFSAAVQTAKGRTSVANDPLAYIMSMAESEITQGNKNRAKQALYNYLLNRTQTDADGNQIQNSLMQVEGVWYVKSVDALGNTVMTMAAPDHASGETYEEFEARMEALAATGDAVKSKKGKIDIGMRFQKPANMGAHYVHLKVNGVDKAIYINGDPKAADAINGTYKKERNELSEAMGKWNRFLSSMFTNYSLEFTVRNYFRDMLYSHINIGIKESDPAYRKKFRQNWRHNNFGSMVKMLKAFRAGEFEGRALTEDEAAFVEFMKNGGQTGYVVLNKVETHRAELEKAIERMQKGLAKGGVKDSTVFKYTLGGIELLNEASELVTRFAAFKTSRDMGRSVVQSISDAKEVTVNFNTKGAQDGKGFMGMIAHYFGWSKYFFNASVQGVQNLKAMASANKLKFGGVVGGIVATGFLMPLITGAIAQLLGGDEEEYWNIPEYDRQNNFCIPVGNGKYAKIPLPIGFREMYAIGDMVSAMMFDKKFAKDIQSVGTDMANKLATIILPINPLEGSANGLSIWHTLAYTAAPSSAQVLIQNLTNTDWKGAPLQKEYTYNENDPQWMKAFAGNPDWMKLLSKWCNEHINADGDYKGWDWSPEKLDNTISNLFGGVYTLIKKTGKSISMIWNEENRNMQNAPIAGVFLGSGIDSDDRFVTDAYYEMMDYYDSQVGYIKRSAERFGYDLDEVFNKEKGKHHPKMNEIYSNKNFDFMQEWYKGNKDLEKLNDKIKNLEKKIAGKENPTQSDLNKLARLKDQFAVERREFVDDMLELD